MSRKRAFGELETAIINTVKKYNRTTVRQVLQELGEQDSYTTIMTVMNRLVEKKELCRERVGQHYEYWIGSRGKQNIGLLNRLKERIFGGKALAMISYLIETDNDISSQELNEIAKLIEAAKKKEKE